MQSDIVQRLRQPWFTHGCAEYQHEAADEIERNRAEITRLTEALRAAEEEKKGLVRLVERAQVNTPEQYVNWHEDARQALAGAKP